MRCHLSFSILLSYLMNPYSPCTVLYVGLFWGVCYAEGILKFPGNIRAAWLLWRHCWGSHLTQMKQDHVRIEHQWKDIQYSLWILPDNQSNTSPSCSRGDHVPRRTLRDWEQGHKSPRRTLQLLLVSARGEDIEIFAIAPFETLSLDVFVLLFCLHMGFVNVSLSNKSLTAYKYLFLKSNPPQCLLHWSGGASSSIKSL